MKKILLIGSYHGNNKGDEAIIYSFIQRIRKYHKKPKITITSENPDYFIKNYPGIYAFKPSNIFETIINIKRNDIIILGGGGPLFDYGIIDTLRIKKQSQILYWLFTSIISKLFRKKVLWISIGAGPIKTRLSKILTRYISKKVDYISLRDKESVLTMKSIGIKSKLIETRDIVFGMNIKEIEFKNVKPIDLEDYVLVFPRYWKGEEEIIERSFSKAIEKLLEMNLNIVISETNSKTDGKLARKIYNKFNNNRIRYYSMENKSLKSFFSLISNSKFIISMRMHAIIIGSLFKIPSIAIEYKTPKIIESMNLLGLSKYITNLECIYIDLIESMYKSLKINKETVSKNLIKIKSYERINDEIIKNI